MFSGTLTEPNSSTMSSSTTTPVIETEDRLLEIRIPTKKSSTSTPINLPSSIILFLRKVEGVSKPLLSTKSIISDKSVSAHSSLILSLGGNLKEAMSSCRDECDKKFSDYAIYEHCLPFNVSRAFDEAKGIDNPRIWTAQRDKEMWNLLQ